jgi:hypothetical protein
MKIIKRRKGEGDGVPCGVMIIRAVQRRKVSTKAMGGDFGAGLVQGVSGGGGVGAGLSGGGSLFASDVIGAAAAWQVPWVWDNNKRRGGPSLISYRSNLTTLIQQKHRKAGGVHRVLPVHLLFTTS